MASADLSRRVGKVVGYPPLCDMGGQQRREFHEALLNVQAFEDLPRNSDGGPSSGAEGGGSLRRMFRGAVPFKRRALGYSGNSQHRGRRQFAARDAGGGNREASDAREPADAGRGCAVA